ncbi:MAG: NUDIX hydrolase [Nocardioidaceae bacterium]
MAVAPDPSDEVVDVVDDEDRVVGSATRGEVWAGHLRHRAVTVLCRNPAGDVFVHRRAATKSLFPGVYDLFVGGGVGAGESYDDAARREADEELGVRGACPTPLFRYRYDGSELREWVALYELEWVGPVDPPADEIEWWAFLPPPTLLRRLNEWDFVPDSRDLFAHYRSLRSPRS